MSTSWVILDLVRNLRCPVVVGRDAELECLLVATEAAARGEGGVVFLLGEAGVGKSRLAEAAAASARSRGMVILRGRAASSPAPAPYRPFGEALVSALRTPGAPSATAPGFRAALATLVPGWSGEEPTRPAEPSLVLLGEAVLALLGDLGEPAGVLVLLEDLQWADLGTLELLEYLLDKLDGVRAVLVVTVRAGEESLAEEQARSVQARRLADVVVLDRLAVSDVARLISAALGVQDPPVEVVNVVQEASDGLPFLVEEVLASLVATGSLVRDQSGWRVRGALTPAAPPSFAAAVMKRMEQLPPSASRIVGIAAVLGERFDWSLLQAVAGTVEDEIVDALRAATKLQLIEEDQAQSGFRFRHALTRTAVLATLLLPDRVAAAKAALAALEADTSPDPDRLDLAAQLAVTAGEEGRSVELLLASATSALRLGALSSASASAERVLAAAPGPQPTLRALEILLETLVLAGDLPKATATGKPLLARLEAVSDAPEARADVHLRLAEASVAATDWDSAKDHLARAAALTPAGDQRRSVRRSLLEARAALGRHQAVEAADQVRHALAVAERIGLEDLLPVALELMGRVERALDLGGAERWFLRALVAAERSGSTLGQVRALLELGILDMFRLRSPERLLRAERLADEIGAPVLASQASLHLAILQSFRFELDQARAAAQRAYEAGERYNLGLLVPAALQVLIGIDAYLGRQAEAASTFERSLPLMDLDLEVTGRQFLGLAALSVDDRALALAELQRAEALLPEGSPVTRSPFGPVLALLLALEGETPRSMLTGLDGSSDHVVPGALAELVRAVLAGRAGEHVEAQRLFTVADRALAPAPWFRMVGRRLVAEAAVTDGWGSPADWLGEAEGFFDHAGLDSLARGCRSLCRHTGPASTRRRTAPEPELARLGVTRREADVLALVAEGLTNRDIAERLYLSTRTVEKHVERLLLKTGTANRTQLTALAGRLASSRT